MFDKFTPFKELPKQNFSFQPSRYETWIGGQMVASGKISSSITANVVTENASEKVEVTFLDKELNNELASKNIFDKFITATDRLQLVIIPERTNIENMAIEGFKMTIGATRNRKDFNRNEPFCCNLFLQEGTINKITFSFTNPVKLMEFYL